MIAKSPNVSKLESLAIYIFEGGVPEYYKQKNISQNAIKDSNPKYLLTMDMDFNPVYDGIRKLNVADWMLQNS